MSAAPKISVVIPCRNMGAYVGAAIDSIFGQTYPVHEVIVVDDGSHDHTPSVLARFGDRIGVVRGLGRGSAVARNLGILASSGDHIAFLDADDLWMPTKLERQIPRLSAECGFVFTDFYRAGSPDSPGEPKLMKYTEVAEGNVFSNLLRENFISTPSVLVRKDVLAYAGLFKPRLIGGQDFDLWLRLAKCTRFAWIKDPLVFMRNHPGNITISREYPYHIASVWEEVLREHGPSEPTELTYIRSRYCSSLYDAGRHAIRQLDRPSAVRFFAKAWAVGGGSARLAAWSMLSRLPVPVLAGIAHTKRRISQAS